jgi:hypothetical protein
MSGKASYCEERQRKRINTRAALSAFRTWMLEKACFNLNRGEGGTPKNKGPGPLSI